MFETALPTNESVNCNRFVDFAACTNEGYLYVYILINSLKFEKKKKKMSALFSTRIYQTNISGRRFAAQDKLV